MFKNLIRIIFPSFGKEISIREFRELEKIPGIKVTSASSKFFKKIVRHKSVAYFVKPKERLSYRGCSGYVKQRSFYVVLSNKDGSSFNSFLKTLFEKESEKKEFIFEKKHQKIISIVQNERGTNIEDSERLNKHLNSIIFNFGSIFKLGLSPEEVFQALSVICSTNSKDE